MDIKTDGLTPDRYIMPSVDAASKTIHTLISYGSKKLCWGCINIVTYIQSSRIIIKIYTVFNKYPLTEQQHIKWKNISIKQTQQWETTVLRFACVDHAKRPQQIHPIHTLSLLVENKVFALYAVPVLVVKNFQKIWKNAKYNINGRTDTTRNQFRHTVMSKSSHFLSKLHKKCKVLQL